MHAQTVCGLLGIILTAPRHLDGEAIERIAEGLAHRGPDDRGWLALGPGGIEHGRDLPRAITASVLLVHRRLSIIDLTAAGRQPMSSPDGRLHLIYNGEIYNYLELRRELEALGRRFSTQSDSEVLLTAYAEWGKAALDRLVGMFAFAILDSAERRLLLVRDFFGMKPLYHARVEGGLAFASEIEPLLRLAGGARQVNPQRIYDYLRFGQLDHGDETCFAHVAQLPAAHYAEVELDAPAGLRPVRYWSPRPDGPLDVSLDEAAATVRELVLGSLDQHLRSDVAVGAALSGGTESSSIVMGMRALRGESLDLRTFSYIADEPALNEERWVDTVVAASGASSHKLSLGPDDLAADFDRLIDAQGEPMLETPAYAQHRIFQLARESGVTVVLTGEGGDELFGGYDVFLTARLVSLIHRGRLIEASRFAARLRARQRVGRARDVLVAEGMLLPRCVRELVRPLLAEPLVPGWLNTRWLAEHDVVPAAPAQAEGRELLRKKLHLALTETKLPRLLRYADRNSMAFSLECRLPFLTPQLTRFALSLPDELLIGADGTSKVVLRQAMRGIVPDEVSWTGETRSASCSPPRPGCTRCALGSGGCSTAPRPSESQRFDWTSCGHGCSLASRIPRHRTPCSSGAART